jgi:GNAT superfamily N-acetyltransferase
MIVNIRDLALTEKYYNQLLDLYSAFGKFDKTAFTLCDLSTLVANLGDNHEIILYIDTTYTIRGAITLFIEQKIIHNGRRVGHIEDFVVSSHVRNLGIGSLLLNHAIQLSKINKCYKVILDCDPNLEKYYANRGFVAKGLYMGLYF